MLSLHVAPRRIQYAITLRRNVFPVHVTGPTLPHNTVPSTFLNVFRVKPGSTYGSIPLFPLAPEPLLW